MAMTRVRTADSGVVFFDQGTGTQNFATFDGSVTVGDLVVVGVATFGERDVPTSVTHGSDAMTQIANDNRGSGTGGVGLTLYYRIATTTSTGITATMPGAGAPGAIGGRSYSGNVASSPLDGSAVTRGETTTSHTTGTVDPTTADSVAFGGFVGDNTPTKDAAYTLVASATQGGETMVLADRIFSADPGATAMVTTSSPAGNSVNILAVLKGAAGGGGGDTQLWLPVTPLVRRRSTTVVPSGVIGIRAAA